ncbi:MAG: MBOAT family protein [Methylococcales bacterium]|jgi:D-alanyl-lipoteichoic acid acyltransferase DltB (MBOAT superfamily)|nr:MBOAT family protein [Methylococcales bacterium]
MLFNSHVFIFGFLPIVFFGFYGVARFSHNLAALWLTAASLFFYGWWDVRFVWLLLSSIAFNYRAGYLIGHRFLNKPKLLLTCAIISNLILLGYFKYANFFIENLNHLTGVVQNTSVFILPLGISFFTFTQIAFLVDTYQGKVKEYNFIHYTLFVTYFPHLIAGPVLHHKEMMPQFAKSLTYRFNYENLLVGLTIFFIGLFKKVVVADGIAKYVGQVFAAHVAGVELNFLDAWGGALCYTIQLYFDFSGYSDMAIGLSRLFGVTLPLNFHSPYKSVNIIEFWRRWHMTLSHFLRDYLYIPLGGNRKGNVRRHLNLLITMLLGGLWHGAGWTYVFWGGLHGCYLVINHGWQVLHKRFWHKPPSKLLHALSVLITFLAVVVAWVVFRADNINTATAILKAMAGMNGFALPDVWLPQWGAFGQWLSRQGVAFSNTNALIKGGAINWIVICLLFVWVAPNTQQMMANFKPVLKMPEGGSIKLLLWHPTYTWLVASVVCAVLSILNISELSEFIYFQF